MFDPSKLDLDLNENNNSEKKQNTEEKQESVQKETTQKVEESTDVLDSISIDEENKNISKQNDDNTVGADLVSAKDEEKTNSESTEEKKEETKDNKEKTEETVVNEVKEETVEIEKEEDSQEANTQIEENKTVFDINLVSLDILLKILVKYEYDFAVFEPNDDWVKATFSKDKVVADTKYIKYPTYTNILLKAKALTKLTIEETEQEQEGAWETIVNSKAIKVLTKVVPSDSGPKLFIKTKEIQKKVVKKQATQTSANQILGFLWALAFIALVIGWGFLAFVVMNAKTVEDVKFFQSLWISLNDINNFISQAVSIIFSILVFIETIFLITILFKFSLTKKEFKQKKIRYGIISAIIFIVTFSTASTWMLIDQKIRNLPNWQAESQWELILYDNSKLISDEFNEIWSEITDTTELIWPVTIKFDLENYKTRQERKWFIIKKYIWNFWVKDDIIETPTDTIIHSFDKKGIYEISLTTIKADPSWEIVEELVTWIPNINISNVVEVEEILLNSWGKLVNFDASSISNQGKIEWYYMDDLSKPVWKWETFKPWKPIFEETLIWMYIRADWKKDETIDKIFVITAEEETSLDWEIKFSRGIINDLEFELWVDNLDNDFGQWYIEKFKWYIWDKEITKDWNINDPSESSKIKHSFKNYWEQEVRVVLTNSSWKTKELKTIIEIPKLLKLDRKLRITNDWKVVENYNYNTNLSEYYLNEISIPTKLNFNARFVKPNDPLYSLKNVTWDINSDWDIDKEWKTFIYELNKEGNHSLTVNYEFIHIKKSNDTIKISEQIFIEWVKKEAIIDFVIKKDSNYVPVIVGFDASKSQVKDENIEKFIWDYWDGETEVRDAVVKWHRYTSPWNYEVVLKVITTTWKTYTTSKKLILKPKPQDAQINVSMKTAPVWQAIDFSSDKSEWQIIWYFWEFGDWKTTTDPNPTYTYKKPWKYTVKLTLDFANKSIETDTMEIVIE